jgi:hypothetical protein
MANREYQRLTRSHARSAFNVAFVSRSSLWLAPDHLLLVDSNGYTETYKRFYFRDIQALTLALTKRRLVWNCILGAAIGLCLLGWGIDWFTNPPVTSASIIIGSVVTAIFVVPLLLNTLFGPTCKCCLKTAVQTEELPPLKRLRRARKVMARLRLLIAQAQSQRGTEQIPVAGQEQPGSAGVSPAGAVSSPGLEDFNAPPPPAGMESRLQAAPGHNPALEASNPPPPRAVDGRLSPGSPVVRSPVDHTGSPDA